MDILMTVGLCIVVALIVCVLTAFAVKNYLTTTANSKLEQVKRDIKQAEDQAERIINDATREAKTTKKTALV